MTPGRVCRFPAIAAPRIGTIDWLFREYRQSRAYLEKVKPRSRRNYEWAMREVCDTLTKRGDRVGGRPIKSVTRSAPTSFMIGLRWAKGDATPHRRKNGRAMPEGMARGAPAAPCGVSEGRSEPLDRRHDGDARQADQARGHPRTGLCVRAGCVARGEPECGAAAVICFEWLQRPENVIAGHIKWTGYRTGPKSTIRIEHHKTGAVIDHPLEERLADGDDCQIL